MIGVAKWNPLILVGALHWPRASFETPQVGLLRMTRFLGCKILSHGEERRLRRVSNHALHLQQPLTVSGGA